MYSSLDSLSNQEFFTLLIGVRPRPGRQSSDPSGRKSNVQPERASSIRGSHRSSPTSSRAVSDSTMRHRRTRSALPWQWLCPPVSRRQPCAAGHRRWNTRPSCHQQQHANSHGGSKATCGCSRRSLAHMDSRLACLTGIVTSIVLPGRSRSAITSPTHVIIHAPLSRACSTVWQQSLAVTLRLDQPKNPRASNEASVARSREGLCLHRLGANLDRAGPSFLHAVCCDLRTDIRLHR
jgi:hypothetical protein